MKLREKSVAEVVVNGVTRKAEVIAKQPENSIKIDVKNRKYEFYEVVEKIDEDTHHWIYAVLK